MRSFKKISLPAITNGIVFYVLTRNQSPNHSGKGIEKTCISKSEILHKNQNLFKFYPISYF